MQSHQIHRRDDGQVARARGTVLIFALLVISGMFIVALPFLSELSSQYRATEKSFRSLAALNLAEAGVERVIWELDEYGGWVSSWTEDGEGVCRLRLNSIATPSGSTAGDVDIKVWDSFPGNSIQVEAAGLVPFVGKQNVVQTVRVSLELGADSVFDFGVFADEGLVLKQNAEIDSYDSRRGFYEDQERGERGHAATNSTEQGSIYLQSNARIFGSIAAGMGTPEEELDSVINTSDANTFLAGVKYSLREPFDMDISASLADILAGLEFKGSFESGLHESLVLAPQDSGEYRTFILSVGSTVIIQGHVTVYVTGTTEVPASFLMRPNTELRVADDGASSLTLVLGRATWRQMSNVGINNLSKIPSNLLILGTEEFDSDEVGEMHFDSNTDLYGAIIVPQGRLHYDSNFNLYGSVVCRYLEFNSNSLIHYDEALRDFDTVRGGISQYVVKSWQLISL